MTLKSRNIYTAMVAKALTAFAALGVLVCGACSSNDVIKEIKEIDTTGTDLMRFTRATEIPATRSTRAANYLKTGFMVSTYKAFGITSAQQTVMNKYQVNYTTTGTDWDGNTNDNWEYINVNGQSEKYWDYSNFPYRFNALAPYPTETDVVLADENLSITKSYSYQSCTNGTVTPENTVAEPYMLAQVQRDGYGTDKDIYAGSDISSNATSLNRYVALPFHHLNSKIRFGVYSLNPWATEHKLYIQDLEVKVASTDFVTKANKYEASGTDTWRLPTGNSGFTGLTTATGTTLLSYSGFDASNTLLEDNDLRKHQGQSTAYFLQCPDGIMQIPQEGVKMTVSLKLMQEGTDDPFKTYTNVPVVLKLENSTTQDTYNWVSGNIYTYYLILDFDNKLEIQFTATLAPWEDISGSLNTDLEQ